MNKQDRIYNGMEVAVIGMACSFPGATTVDEYWDNIINYRESIQFFDKDELRQQGISEELIDNPNYIRAKGLVSGYDEFDNDFFGYSNTEAAAMNPQMRILHECIWHALEDAGYIPETMQESISLYAGAASSVEWETLMHLSGEDNVLGGMVYSTLSDKDFICSKIAYNLNLKGNINIIHTACSTSLLAVHQACRSLLTGECNLALAGGISIDPHPIAGYMYREGMTLSPDGHCRPFDENAKGTVYSNGVGMVVLKLLRNAIKDGDHIYAIIKGSASNNDGNRKVSYSAPSVNGQADVIRMAQRFARVAPEDISYIETHGTATPLGDSIEVEALKVAFNTDKRQYCALGSVKGNIGHLDVASGIAGFIKCCLALNQSKLPPNINFNKANPTIDFANSPFYVNTELKNWGNNQEPLYAGVSSFGIGGTNVHVILEDVPRKNYGENKDSNELLVISALNAESLKKSIVNLHNYLINNKDISLSNVAYTLKVGRKSLPYRKSFYCKNIKDAKSKLAKAEILVDKKADAKHKVVFMFAGLGNQYENMGRDLYDYNDIFRAAFQECSNLIQYYAHIKIVDILYPQGQTDIQKQRIYSFDIAQYCIFSFEYALVALLNSWKITSDYMIGYSFGEYVAACVSGLLSLEDAIKLIVKRAELIKRLPQGVMLSIPLPESDLLSVLNEKVEIAITNRDSCIVAGNEEDISALENLLANDKILCARVQNTYPLHTNKMNPIVPEMRQLSDNVTYQNINIPLISCCSARRLCKEDFSEKYYWANHLIATMHFDKTISEILKFEKTLFIEIGPGNNLCALLGRYKETNNDFDAVSLIKNAHQKINDIEFMLKKVGVLWEKGINIDWSSTSISQKAERISIPQYPFKRRKFKSPFIDVEQLLNYKKNSVKSNVVKKDVSEWFYVPTWEQKPIVEMQKYDVCNWLVVLNDLSFSNELLSDVRKSAKDIWVIRNSKEKTYNDKEFYIDFENKAEFDLVCNQMYSSGFVPNKILYLGVLDAANNNQFTKWEYDDYQIAGFYGLLYLVQALSDVGFRNRFEIYAITNQLFRITGHEDICPYQSSVLAACKIIPTEYLNIRCKLIDIELPSLDMISEKEWLLNHIPNELVIRDKSIAIAYRGRRSWVQKFTPTVINTSSKDIIREHGTYVIIGGFGGMGFTIGGFIGKTYKANIALVVRSAFPERNEWRNWVDTHNENDKTSIKINEIWEIEKSSCKLEVFCADITNECNMQEVITKIENDFGIINGVIHAAGVIDYGGIIQRRTKENISEYIKSKVSGTVILDSVFKDKCLDFMIFFSSIGNVLYNYKYGQIAYAIANEFLESMSERLSFERSYKVVVINWCDWLKVGMAIKTINKLHGDNATEINYEEEIKDGIMPEQGIEVFYKFINSELIRATVNQNDLIQLINEHDSLEQNILNFESEKSSTLSNERPSLSAEYVEPRTGKEEKLCNIFAEYYGIDKIGVEDDFFELGCDSLKAMSLIAKIHKEFKIMITINEFFKNATVALLAELLDQKNKSNYYNIKPVEKALYYELSSAQKRQFILHRMDSSNIAYNISKFVKINEKIDYYKLNNAFKRIVDCHESLRTSFHVVSGRPVQQIHDSIDFSLVYRDISLNYFEYIEKNKYIDDMVGGFSKPFNLSLAPLIQAELVKLADEEYILMYEVHHIVSDAISMDIISDELFALYSGIKFEIPNIQYKDYAAWQKDFFKTDVVKSQKEFWLRCFSEDIPILNLPLDFARPLKQTFRGDSISFTLDKSGLKRLYDLCSYDNYTMFMIILAAYNVLLSKITGQKDIIIGTPISGRFNEDIKNMIGMLVNVVAIRNIIDDHESFIKLLGDIKENCMKIYANQDYQFDTLVNDLKPDVDLSRNPIFDTMFTLYQSSKNVGSYNMKISSLEMKQKSTRFDLVLEATETIEGIEFRFEYNVDLFRRDSVIRFSRYLLNVLNEVTNNPAKRVCDINILSDDDRNELLYSFNNTAVAYDKNITLVTLFEKQVMLTPDVVALKCSTQLLNYKELNGRANRLARYLRNKGVKRNSIVGLIVDRSVEMIISILAILKAGGAYLPIDPAYPDVRKNELLTESSAQTVVLHKKYCSGVSSLGTFVYVDSEDSYDNNADNLEPVNKPEDLAYVLFTSGSTGKPKGVMIEHRNAINFIIGINNAINIKENAILALTTYTFDIFFLESILPLAKGMTVYLAEQELLYNTNRLCEYINQEDIEIIQATPTRLNQLGDGPNKFACLSKVKKILVGGEPLNQKLLDELISVGLFEIYNMYGPTETTIWSSIKKFNSNEITIGKPIANTQMYIIDENESVLPIGVAGELCIAGDGLARGYLNSIDLTKKKFKEITSIGVSKAYRTGDQARWKANGEIECLGRIDNQVKINGFRIELEEVENQIRQIEGINETVVVKKSDKNSSSFLCAYYTCNQEISNTNIYELLSNRLPNYMLPRYIIPIEKFPLTFNGKIDKNTLPEPAIMQDSEREYVLPRNNVEKMLVDIWCNIFELKQISIDDNFFALGGQSLKVIQLESVLAQKGYIVDYMLLYELKTIRHIAAYINHENIDKEITGINMDTPITVKSENICYKELNNIEPFNSIYYRNCFYNSLISVIQHYDGNIIAPLANDIEIYTVSTNNQGSMILQMDFVSNNDLIVTVNNMGIQCISSKKCNNLIERVVNAINQEKCVIVWIDIYDEPVRKDTYRKEHIQHSVLVYGYDLSEEIFYIVEQIDKESLTYHKQKIKFNDMEIAYQHYLEIFDSTSVYDSYYEFNYNESIKMVPDDYFYSKLYKKNMKDCINLRRYQTSDLQKYIEYIKKILLSKEELLKEADNLLNTLNEIIMAKKSELFLFEKLFGEKFEAVVAVGSIFEIWSVLRANILRIVYNRDYKKEVFISIIEQLYEVCELETSIIDVICN